MKLDKIVLTKEPGSPRSRALAGNLWSIDLVGKPTKAPRWLMELDWEKNGENHSSRFLLAQGPDENGVQGPINLALFQQLEEHRGLPPATETALRAFLLERFQLESALTQGEVINKLYELLRIRR